MDARTAPRPRATLAGLRRAARPAAVAGGAAGAGLALGVAPRAFAQTDWPHAPVKLIVPYAPGGVTDLLMRLRAKHAAERLGQPVPVENRAGTGGVVGTTAVAVNASVPVNSQAELLR